jgi:hypothetical protein
MSVAMQNLLAFAEASRKFYHPIEASAAHAENMRAVKFNSEVDVRVAEVLMATRGIKTAFTALQATQTLRQVVCLLEMDFSSIQTPTTDDGVSGTVTPVGHTGKRAHSEECAPAVEQAAEDEGGFVLAVRPCPEVRQMTFKRTRTASRVDMFKTPDSAILGLVYTMPTAIRPTSGRALVIWDPFAGIGDNPFGRILRELGYEVIETDIQSRAGFRAEVQQGLDFFGRMPIDADGHERPVVPTDANGGAIRIDGIITNPPYSRTNEFLARVQELNVWWGALLPLTTFEGAERLHRFQDMAITARIIPNRVNFGSSQEMEVAEGRVKASNCMPFNCSWFTRFPGEAGLLMHTSLCPVLPFVVSPEIALRCFADTTRRYTLLEVARLHVAEFYPGMRLTEAGKVVTASRASRRIPASKPTPITDLPPFSAIANAERRAIHAAGTSRAALDVFGT